VNTLGISKAVQKGHIEWNRHALERMIERGIARETAKKVLMTGDIIEDYPDDAPYPSALFLGYVDNRPFHVVAAFDAENDLVYVITVYIPDSEHFENNHKTRR
jgi:hypothetical protein